MFANPRGFSQLTTSFFAFESLGIPHLLFLTFYYHTSPFCKTGADSFSFLNNVNELFAHPEGFARDNIEFQFGIVYYRIAFSDPLWRIRESNP